ncbi:MAG: hypothetical protein M1128_01220 [Candidatus Marsarchaeota archaeon]|nr:hypothetical protein [Candidatus Marsarchaeota archaeon]
MPELIFQEGLLSPIIITSIIGLQSNKSINRTKINFIKLKIKDLLIKRKDESMYISDIAEILNVRPSEVKLAVSELIEEGFLKG